MAALFNKDKAKSIFDAAKQKASDTLANVNTDNIKNTAASTLQQLSEAGSKTTAKLSDVGASVSKSALEAGKATSQKVSTLVATAGVWLF